MMNEQKSKLKRVFNWAFFISFCILYVPAVIASVVWHLEYVNAGTFLVPMALASFIIATIVCRKRGLSLEERKVTKLKATHTADNAPNDLELYDSTPYTGLIWAAIAISIGFSLLLLVIMLVVPIKQQTGRPYGFALIGFVMVAALYLFSTLKNKHLLFKTNVQQFTTSKALGGKKKLAWNQIICCEIIEGKNVFGDAFTLVNFYGKFNKLLVTTALTATKPEDRNAFIGYLKQRFTED